MQQLLSNWLSDLNGKNQNTYKFALQLAILDNCDQQEITYYKIAESFAKRYWNNVITYNLRESTNIDQSPHFHQAIIKIARIKQLEGLFFNHAINVEKDLLSLIINELKDGYKKILQNPISRLQNDSTSIREGSGSNNGHGWLYKWDSSKEIITIKPDYLNQIKLNQELFKKLTIFHWALFIERYNQIPSVTNKLLLDSKKSRAIKKLVRELITGLAENICFYCNQKSENIHIDHFIPYAFLFDNPLWDLVCSCAKCNNGQQGKFEKLPNEHYLKNLLARNQQMFSEDQDIFEGYYDFNQLKKHILDTYQACKNAGFTNWEYVNTDIQKNLLKNNRQA